MRRDSVHANLGEILSDASHLPKLARVRVHGRL